jgi:CheY-like chemotaxis protein
MDYLLFRLRYHACKLIAAWIARSKFPDDLRVDRLRGKIGERIVSVAVIDDEPFPYIDPLEQLGYKIKIFNDYTRPKKQSTQKLKAESFDGFDIILCDIHGVGQAAFHELEGLQVMKTLREQFPFKVIIAYTGTPGDIASRLKPTSTVDGIFAKEWGIDDFLTNFLAISEIFKIPAKRWMFLKRRLEHLDVGEAKISQLRDSFVRYHLMCQLLTRKTSLTEADMKPIIEDVGATRALANIAASGVKVIELLQLIAPLYATKGN